MPDPAQTVTHRTVGRDIVDLFVKPTLLLMPLLMLAETTDQSGQQGRVPQ